MARLLYIMGKSATGKDTILKELKKRLELKEYVLYTTRPKRNGELDGINYNFISDEEVKKLKNENKVIEYRVYNTVMGPWTYLTVLDEQLNQEGDIITVGTLESYKKVLDFFDGKDGFKILPIYILIDEEERRKRAIKREQEQEKPNYDEMERRLAADNLDFSEEKLNECEITREVTFENNNLDKCIKEIEKYIDSRKVK